MTTKTAPTTAPSGLSERSQTLWREIIVSRNVRSPGRLTLLEQALRSLDRADQAAEIIAAEGLVTTTKATGAAHVHPALRVERESRQLFARIWDALRLGFDPEADGRLP